MLPHNFFLWRFLSVMFHMCFFSLCPHSVFTTKFPLSVPAYMPFYQLVSSSELGVVRATAHIFITPYGEENWLPQKGHGVHIENLIFSKAFSSTRVLATVRISSLSLLVGPPPPSHFPLLTDFPIRSSSLWVNKIILYSHIPRDGKDCPSL